MKTAPIVNTVSHQGLLENWRGLKPKGSVRSTELISTPIITAGLLEYYTEGF